MTEPRPCLSRIKPYVPGKPIEELKREKGIDDIIKMASNENPYGPSEKARSALYRAMRELERYPDGNCTMLKRKLASRLDLGEENLIIGNGSDGILKLIAETYLDPGTATVFPEPSFVEYRFVTQLLGADCIPVALDDRFEHDLEAMLASVEEAKAKMVFICNPNNPTGTIVRESELTAFLEKLPDEVLAVIDEAYFEYANEPEYPDGVDYVKQGKNVIVLRTFSKIYGLASLRVGYGIACEETIANIHKAREPFNVNRLAHKAAEASLDDENHVEECRALNTAGLEMLYRGFSSMGLKYVESQANFVLVKVPMDSRELYEKLLNRGIIIRPGANLGCPGYIRVTVGKPADNRRFLGELADILNR